MARLNRHGPILRFRVEHNKNIAISLHRAGQTSRRHARDEPPPAADRTKIMTDL
jgi:hypothetical protein